MGSAQVREEPPLCDLLCKSKTIALPTALFPCIDSVTPALRVSQHRAMSPLLIFQAVLSDDYDDSTTDLTSLSSCTEE